MAAARCGGRRQAGGSGGEEWCTFRRFPPAPGRGLRPTTALERINDEVGRRTKTQASWPKEDALVRLLWGLLRRGQVVLRRFTGWNERPAAAPLSQRQAA